MTKIFSDLHAFTTQAHPNRETHHAVHVHHSEENAPMPTAYMTSGAHKVAQRGFMPSYRENLTVLEEMGTGRGSAVTEPCPAQIWPAFTLASTSCIGGHIRCGDRMTDRRLIDRQTDSPIGAAVLLAFLSRTCYSVWVFATVPWLQSPVVTATVTVTVGGQVNRRTGEVSGVRCQLCRTCEVVTEFV